VRRAVLLIAAFLLLSGCGFFPVMCTAVGCESGVLFTLEQDLLAETEYQVTACVDDRCAEGVLEVGPNADGLDGPLSLVIGDTDTVFYDLGEFELHGEHHVTLRVLTADDELVVEWAGTAAFERSQPNGPSCEPTCWLAEVRA